MVELNAAIAKLLDQLNTLNTRAFRRQAGVTPTDRPYRFDRGQSLARDGLANLQ